MAPSGQESLIVAEKTDLGSDLRRHPGVAYRYSLAVRVPMNTITDSAVEVLVKSLRSARNGKQRNDLLVLLVEQLVIAGEVKGADMKRVIESLNSQIRWFCDNRQRQRDPSSPRNVLNVAVDAGIAEITAAYRRLAQQHHPGRGGDAGEFQQLREVYRRPT